MPKSIVKIRAMRVILSRLLLCMTIMMTLPTPAMALNEDLQCVPYARAISGIEIYGDAHTWWDKAKGRYGRGDEPRVGAILSFKPHKASSLGHISAVRAIVNKRTILVSHANWSRINGTRGHIEDDVQVVDVSKKNDWSQVKVWYQPIGALGGTVYPINGFIYPKKQKSHAAIKASIAKLTGRPVSKVALQERPHMGNIPINKRTSNNRRLAQLSSRQNEQAQRKQSKKRKQQDFSLDNSFLKDLEKKSRKEKALAARNARVQNNGVSQNVDPIGALLGQVGQ